MLSFQLVSALALPTTIVRFVDKIVLNDYILCFILEHEQDAKCERGLDVAPTTQGLGQVVQRS